MTDNILHLSAVLLLTAVTVLCDDKPVVDTTHGKISGTFLKTLYKDVEYSAFMGIPYALPPVKDMKFLVSLHLYPTKRSAMVITKKCFNNLLTC